MWYMLKLNESFIGVDVLSLRTGSPIATTTQAIINPNNLRIEGWHVVDRFDKKKPLILLGSDVRDFLDKGIVVNDHEVLTAPKELVRLKPILELEFELIGKPVTTQSNKKVGKVSDYALESSSLFIKKLYVSQSLVKNFSGGTLSIDRQQIIEITTRRIIIDDPVDKATVKAAAPSPAT